MATLNKVLLIGNLTRDPELKYIPSGDAVATLGLAVNREYTSRDGEKKSEVLFIDVVVWRKQAEACSQYLSKGSPVFVEGTLHMDNWESQDGQKRSKLRVQAQRVQFLGSPRRDAQSAQPAQDQLSGAQAQQADPDSKDDDIPF